MCDTFSQALTLMAEAFADAQAGAGFLAPGDLAAEVDGAQRVVNAAGAVQALRVAQYAGRQQEPDGSGVWVDVDHGVGHVSELASDCFGPMLAMSPVAASRKFIQKRDGTCRFPTAGEAPPAANPTTSPPTPAADPPPPWNLASLCKHHHRVKHNAGWTLTMTRQGACTWTDPHGRQYATNPADHHELAA